MSLTKFYFFPLTGNSHDRARCVSFFHFLDRTNERKGKRVGGNRGSHKRKFTAAAYEVEEENIDRKVRDGRGKPVKMGRELLINRAMLRNVPRTSDEEREANSREFSSSKFR